jgi:hypothetical protein
LFGLLYYVIRPYLVKCIFSKKIEIVLKNIFLNKILKKKSVTILGEGHEGHEVQQRGRPRKHGRATLTWKKGQDDDDDERHPHDKRNRKRKHRDNKDSIGSIKEDSGNDPEEDFTGIFDDLPPEKSLQCQVSLAEINRKLGIVMCQPV